MIPVYISIYSDLSGIHYSEFHSTQKAVLGATMFHSTAPTQSEVLAVYSS